MVCALYAKGWNVWQEVIITTILKTGSYHRRVLAPEDGDVNYGLAFPRDLGLQGQRDVNGAVGGDYPTGGGTREQYGRQVLIYLVGEKSQSDKQAWGTVWNQECVRLFWNKHCPEFVEGLEKCSIIKASEWGWAPQLSQKELWLSEVCKSPQTSVRPSKAQKLSTMWVSLGCSCLRALFPNHLTPCAPVVEVAEHMTLLPPPTLGMCGRSSWKARTLWPAHTLILIPQGRPSTPYFGRYLCPQGASCRGNR